MFVTVLKILTPRKTVEVEAETVSLPPSGPPSVLAARRKSLARLVLDAIGWWKPVDDDDDPLDSSDDSDLESELTAEEVDIEYQLIIDWLGRARPGDIHVLKHPRTNNDDFLLVYTETRPDVTTVQKEQVVQRRLKHLNPDTRKKKKRS